MTDYNCEFDISAWDDGVGLGAADRRNAHKLPVIFATRPAVKSRATLAPFFDTTFLAKVFYRKNLICGLWSKGHSEQSYRKTKGADTAAPK